MIEAHLSVTSDQRFQARPLSTQELWSTRKSLLELNSLSQDAFYHISLREMAWRQSRPSERVVAPAGWVGGADRIPIRGTCIKTYPAHVRIADAAPKCAGWMKMPVRARLVDASYSHSHQHRNLCYICASKDVGIIIVQLATK